MRKLFARLWAPTVIGTRTWARASGGVAPRRARAARARVPSRLGVTTLTIVQTGRKAGWVGRPRSAGRGLTDGLVARRWPPPGSHFRTGLRSNIRHLLREK